MSYPITSLDGMDEDAVALLREAGIRTTEKLLEAAKDARGRKVLATRTGLDEKVILSWANKADRMRIKGMGKDYADLLQAAGVKTVRDLKYRNPSRLAMAMAAANKKKKLVQVLPSEKAVVRWIDQAKRLPLKISY
jgi:predicted RecB family nuclease